MPLDYSSYGFNPYNFNFQNYADEYFVKAYQAPNLNNPAFKGASSTGAANPNIAQTGGTTQVNGGIPVNTTPAEQSSGLAGTLIGGTIFLGGAATCIVAAKKGKFGQAWNALKKMVGKGTEESTNVVENCLKKMTAYKDAEGNMRIMIPGKKGKPIVGKDNIEEFARKNYANEVISAERQAFTQQSVLKEYQVFSDGKVYNVAVKDGNVVKIYEPVNPDANLLERFSKATAGTTEASQLEYFKKVLTELGKDKDSVDKTILSSVSNIRYTNTYGDNILEMSVSEYGKTPLMQKLTTLERFSPESTEFKKTALKEGEEFFGNPEFLNGKFVDGAKLGVHPEKIKYTTVDASGNKVEKECIGNFNGRELVSITETVDGVAHTFPKDSPAYNMVIESKDGKKSIENILKGIFDKKGTLSNGSFVTAP